MCATPETENQDPYTPPSDPDFLANNDPIVYNMNFQIIYPETALSQYTVTVDDCLQVIANMNREFNLFFKYRGMNIVNSDTYYFIERETNDNPNDGCAINELSGFYNFVDEPGNYVENSLNTFVFYDSCGFSGVSLGDGKIGVRWPRFKEWHTIHELGHMFGLNHTHSGFSYDPEDVDPNNITDCERVTRDETSSNFNAYVKGDRFKDTAAMPVFGSNTNGQNNSVNSNCEYAGTGKDCGGDDYQIQPDSSGTLNFMNNGSECPFNALYDDNEGFTQEQGIKMYHIASNTTNDGLNNAITSVASLYEPNSGTYPQQSHPVSYNNQVLMQPGFDYKFIKCGHGYNEPSDYSDTSFNLYTNDIIKTIDKYSDAYSFMYHPNTTAIHIDQLPGSQSIVNARKCYDFQSRPWLGKVMQFNDNVFNNNVTIETKSAEEIVDPNLIPSLEPGLYKIETQFEDGTKEEVIIYKDNN